MKENKSGKKVLYVILIIIFYVFLSYSYTQYLNSKKSFRIISSIQMKDFEEELLKFSSDNHINLSIDYYGDLEIVDILNGKDSTYDAVWISNSIWLSMLNSRYLVSESKFIGISPVVFFRVKKSKAQSLGLVNSEIYNRDIVNLIKNKKLKYTMLSVVRTNSGMTSYFTILYNLAGRPDVLTSEMLKKSIIKDLGSFYSVVESVAGDEEFSIEIFKNGNYDSIISYESSLIKLNKELIEMGKEPLYLLYPVD